VEALARSGLIEWSVVDPGSVNIAGYIYINPEEHVRHGLALAARYGFHPAYAIYEPGFVRLGAALARAGGARRNRVPLHALGRLHLRLPPASTRSTRICGCWQAKRRVPHGMVGGSRGRAEARSRGDRARRACARRLEDAPLGSQRSNLDWVQAARLLIERAGATLASADDVRQALKRRT